MKKIRDSRFEALRIIAILMIVLSHFSLYGQQYRLTRGGVSLSDFLGIRLFQPVGPAGAYLFVMITGFFVGNQVIEFKKALSKGIQVWLETIFYTLIIFLIFVLSNNSFWNLKNLLMAVFPFTFRAYWFVSAYIMLTCLTPFINIVLVNINKIQWLVLIVVTTTFFSVFPIINNFVGAEANSLGILVPPYLIGAYIHKFQPRFKHIAIVFSGVMCLLLMYLLSISISLFKGAEHGKAVFVGLLPLLLAVSIFLVINNSNTYRNKIMNQLSSTVFAGYLITENVLVRPVIWKILSFKNVSNIWIADLLGLLSVCAMIFIGAFLIDKIRQYIFHFFKANKLYAKSK
ncbi:acyltransferase family protein [Oenococcus sp.]|uniref:acyltransferase family protein n=1 Tax=Oenococcus sp. TaxID=1979414 RepID=UPI0039EC110F